MKLVVSFYGMCLCVLDKRKGATASRATVLLLNGAAPPSTARRALVRPEMPYHHPLLFVPTRHADLARSTWSSLPTPEALVDTEGLLKGPHAAWSLAGLDLTLGRGKGVTLHQHYADDDLDNGRLPDPKTTSDSRAYVDWRRIPDLNRIAPGARLRAGYTKIGPRVLGMVRVANGELRGGAPKNADGNSAPWRFSDTFDQVITDRFEFHTELRGADLVATGYASGRKQSIRLRGGASTTVRLTVVHEATPFDVKADDAARLARPMVGGVAPAPDLPHYLAFYDAIEGRGVDRLNPPLRSGPGPDGPRRSIVTPNCPPALI